MERTPDEIADETLRRQQILNKTMYEYLLVTCGYPGRPGWTPTYPGRDASESHSVAERQMHRAQESLSWWKKQNPKKFDQKMEF